MGRIVGMGAKVELAPKAELKKVKSELTKITKELETVKAEKENLTKELEAVKVELAKVNKK